MGRNNFYELLGSKNPCVMLFDISMKRK